MDERLLDADGCCPSCGDPDLQEFERSVASYSETYYSEFEKAREHPDRVFGVVPEPRGRANGYDQTCPRCGQGTDRLVGLTHRGGDTRYVCEDCEQDGRAGDRSFWHWFHKE